MNGQRIMNLPASAATALIALYFANAAAIGQQAAEPHLNVKRIDGVEKIRLLPPGPENPRNSEGDFIRLASGRILFVYTHFFGGGSDDAAARLESRFSDDGGRTWSREDATVIENEGDCNVMSVSLLRLTSGRIALFYLRKNSLTDCRPFMRISTDEAQTWSEAIRVIDDHVGYYVLNNDRVVQLESGRLIAPVALHNAPDYDKPDWAGTVMCYLSDDEGRSWKRSRDSLVGRSDVGSRVMLQEPGVVQLEKQRLMMFCRTDAGRQYVSFSQDEGDTWSPFKPSNIVSPRSPASIERIPSTDDLLMVWNDHEHVPAALQGKRTPLKAAISRDRGKTWQNTKTLEDDPHGWYCYTAIHFVDDYVLLGHCAGDRRTGGLACTQITRIPLAWLYSPKKDDAPD